MKTYHIRYKREAIALLKGARKRVKAGTAHPICYAIRSSYIEDFKKADEKNNKKWSYHAASEDLTDWISENLGTHAYYYSWLKAKSAKFRRANYFEQVAAVKAGRLAWIDWMISELEAAK